MFLCLNLLRSNNPLDNTFLVNNEGCTENTDITAPIHFLLTQYAKLLHQRLVRIGNQRKRQLILRDEFLVRLLAVSAHSYHSITLLPQLRIVVAQAASLRRTARCIVFRIKVQHQFSTCEITLSDFLSFFILSQNLGSLITYFHMLHFNPFPKIKEIIHFSKNNVNVLIVRNRYNVGVFRTYVFTSSGFHVLGDLQSPSQ